MLQIAVHQAKNQLSALIHAVEDGQDVVLTRHGKPVVRIVREQAVAARPSRDEQMQAALAKLHAFQELVKPALAGYTDWRTLRDEGRE